MRPVRVAHVVDCSIWIIVWVGCGSIHCNILFPVHLQGQRRQVILPELDTFQIELKLSELPVNPDLGSKLIQCQVVCSIPLPSPLIQACPDPPCAFDWSLC